MRASRRTRSIIASRVLLRARCWSQAGLRQRRLRRYAITSQALASATLRCSPALHRHWSQRRSAWPPDALRIIVVAGLKKIVLRTGMEALYFSGAHHLLRPVLGGVGAILTLHHVRPPRKEAFQPN